MPARTVIITGRRREPLQSAAEAMGSACKFILHDVTDVKSAALLEKITDLMSAPPTILINNAGINLKKAAVDTTDEEFTNVMNTNVMGAFALTRAFAPGMIKRNKGCILFTASMASYIGIPYVIAYTAAKSALTGMVRALAVEFSPHNVRVNAIAPGWIDSAMLRKAFTGDPNRRDRVLQRTPMGHVGEPDDVAYAVVYLCSPAAKFITGTTLIVDGGISAGF